MAPEPQNMRQKVVSESAFCKLWFSFFMHSLILFRGIAFKEAHAYTKYSRRFGIFKPIQWIRSACWYTPKRLLCKCIEIDINRYTYWLSTNQQQLWQNGDCYVRPQSDIRCNRFATFPRLTISTDRRGRNKVPDRSRRGCREVGD